MKNIFRFRKQLKFQLVGYFISASAVIILLMGSVLFYGINGILLENELTGTSEAIDQSGKYIETYIDKLRSVSYVISRDSAISRYLRNKDGGDRKDTLSLISRVLESDQYISGITIVSKDGEVISSEKSVDMTVSSNMMQEKWYVQAIKGSGMPFLTSLRKSEIVMDKNFWVISMSQEILDESGDNLGVLLIDVKYEFLDGYLDVVNLGKNGYSFLISNSNELVYHKDITYFEDNSKTNELIKFASMSDGYSKEMGQTVHKIIIEDTDWILVGVSSMDEYFMIRRQMKEVIVMGGVLIGLFGLIGGIYYASRITKPFSKLEQSMLEVESGLKKIEYEDSMCLEVEVLSEHFNNMVQRIEELMSDIKDNEKYLRSYELNALRSQINPHFLYNTLDTIVWMAEFGDTDMVIKVTKSLANFFRLSLSGGKEMITVAEEVKHVSEYLMIQSVRYEDKLRYSFDISDDANELIVPKIILQPIVENSIYHGIKEKDGAGEVKISAKIVGEGLVLCVADDGVGFSLDKDIPKSEDVKLGGIGISNVDKRIKLYYGDVYGIKIKSKVGEGTLVTINLPINRG